MEDHRKQDGYEESGLVTETGQWCSNPIVFSHCLYEIV